MTALDPALCARLVSEAKTHHEVTQREQPPCDGPDCKGGEHFLPCAAKVHRNAVVDAWIWKEAHLRDLADQLEAALAEVGRMRPVVDAAVRVAELDEICEAHPRTDDEVGNQAERDLPAAVLAGKDAIDAYRKAKP